MKQYILWIVLLLGSSAIAHAQESGTIKGKVIDIQTDAAIDYAEIILLQEGTQRGFTTTDIGGNYNLANVAVGEYDLMARYTGYPSVTIQKIYVNSGAIVIQDIKMDINSTEIIVLIADKFCCDPVPIVDIPKEDIEKAPETSIDAIISAVAGLNIADSGEEIEGPGRAFGNATYVDGRLVDAASINPLDIENISIMTTGIPARYGNATGFITNITTKGPSSSFRGGVQVESSQFLDAFGGNTINAFFSGPIISRNIKSAVDGSIVTNEDGTPKKITVLGYRLSGTYLTSADNRPSALGTFRLRDDKLQEILDNPLVQNASGTGYVSAADYLTEDDLERTSVRSNARGHIGQYSAKIDYRPSESLYVTVGSQGQFNWGKAAGVSNQLFNYNYNPTQNSSNWGVNARVRHTLVNTIPGNGESGEDADRVKNTYQVFQNFSYELQGDYTETNFSTQDPRHGDRFWDYGYVGKFYESRQPIIGAVDSVAITNSVSDTIGWDFQQGHQAFYNSFDKYEANTEINPGLAAYNQHLAAPRGFGSIGGFDPAAPSSINEMEIINGLNVGGRESVYGLFNAPHINGSNFSKSQTTQARANVVAYFDLVTNQASGNPLRHKIEIGGLFEQRIERSYSMDPFSLWNLAYQTTNNHISNSTDREKATGEVYYDPITQRQYDLYEALVRTDEDGNQAAMSTFATNIRAATGKANNEWVNVHEMTPDEMQLSWFEPTTLITGRQRVLSYYGYDYLGNKTGASTTFNEFFTATDEQGNKTRPIAPNKPVYAAGYIQDQFTYKDIICRFGVRFDHYDANTSVLKDPYSITGYETAAEFESNSSLYEAGNSTEYRRPETIGDDYAVYVNNNSSDAAVVGYRKGDQWYDAQGLAVNSANELGSSFTPALKGIGSSQVDPQGEQYNPNDAFRDYTPQVVVMPRISISFPINKDASFYASYDMLAQRPSAGAFATPYDYYNFREITSGGGVINNPNLQPEKTVNYEVGYQQALTKNTKMKISMVYREDRNMIQLRQYINAYPTTYTSFGNDDFATTKSFKLEYETRRVNNLRMVANYVLQFAEGTGSNPTSSAGVAARELKNVFGLDTDQRHTFYALLDYRFGKGDKYNGPRIKQTDILENTGLSMTINANSGRPYTSKSIPGGIGTSFADRITDGSINGSRKPWNFRVSLRLDKDFTIGKKSKNPLMVNVYVRVENLLNTQNVLNVYSTTGSPVDDGFLTAANSPGSGFAESQADSYEMLYDLRASNPYNISRPRRIFLGARVMF